ncbi:MAG: tetratricopeptide repeat protein, partial [Spirochaetia bacterium]|nr:tetratricopeptide repeat protein [Spirochaetia bacterium]
METSDLDMAEKSLREAMEKEPENSSIMINFGLLCLKKNDKEQAKSFFRTALEFDPDNKYAKKYLEEIE